MLADGPISFKMGLQGLTAQSAMEAELVAAALTMKEAVFCKNKMEDLKFKDGFDSVPLYMDNTCLLYTSSSPRDRQKSRMPSSA